jgi:hypothetical protein
MVTAVQYQEIKGKPLDEGDRMLLKFLKPGELLISNARNRGEVIDVLKKSEKYVDPRVIKNAGFDMCGNPCAEFAVVGKRKVEL